MGFPPEQVVGKADTSRIQSMGWVNGWGLDQALGRLCFVDVGRRYKDGAFYRDRLLSRRLPDNNRWEVGIE